MVQIQTIWKHLSTSAGFPPQAGLTLLIIAAVTPEDWFEFGLDHNPMSPDQPEPEEVEDTRSC